MNTIGRYHLIEKLGRGGMANVYRAYDPHFERQVAIKIMKTSPDVDDGTFLQRFKNEAKMIASLEHAAIVPVYDFGEENGLYYLVMRLMANGTLAERLRRGPLSPNEAIGLLEKIGPALDKAHRKGIIHRDLKPANILFDEQDNPYISDFGLARPMVQTTGGLTVTGGILGTPAYMSPEQAMGDQVLDGCSDIYSIGVIFFHMLSGRRPYKAKTPMALAFKHIGEPVPSLTSFRPDLPAIYNTVIAKAMAKKPEERYKSVKEMIAALTSPTVALKQGAANIDEPSDYHRDTVLESKNAYTLIDHQGNQYELNQQPLTIGRVPSCDIHIRGDEKVSRTHATIAIVNDEALVCDKGSSNGTFINEQAVSHQGMLLRVGDTLRIGETRFQFKRPPTSQPLSPAVKPTYSLPHIPLDKATAQHVNLSSLPSQSRVANMTQVLMTNMSQKMENMSNPQVAALAIGTIGGFVLVTWLVGDFIRITFPNLWSNLPLYYSAALIIRAISGRQGSAFGVHLLLHILMSALTQGTEEIFKFFISAFIGGAIFEGSFNPLITSKIPDWARFPITVFIAYLINLLILGGTTTQMGLAIISASIIGGLTYIITEAYKGYKQAR